MADHKVLLSVGHGYVARAATPLFRRMGWQVVGTTRSAEKAAAVAASGAEPAIWPGADLDPWLDRAGAILSSVAPGEAGDPVLAALGGAIAARAGQVRWVGYLSTTGVYGDRGGDWVDETSACRPDTVRGQRRLDAERAWAAIPGLPLHIFRLAGIYGPGRGPFARLRAGTARRIVKPGQVFSRIHVADIADVLAASLARPDPGAIYNVCDDLPAPPEDVTAFAAELLGLPVPPAIPFEEAEMSEMARSFYADSKRVRNDRIKRDLGVTLRYPTYREGLRAVLAEEDRAAG